MVEDAATAGGSWAAGAAAGSIAEAPVMAIRHLWLSLWKMRNSLAIAKRLFPLPGAFTTVCAPPGPVVIPLAAADMPLNRYEP
jgi:hypothetical protein